MNDIAGIYYLFEDKLNKKYYFQSLLKEGYEAKFLNDRQIEKLQLSLYNLLTKQVNRYTSLESTSVRTEKAQQIFESICYCIGVYLKTVPGIENQLKQLEPDNIESLFNGGIGKLKEYMSGSLVMLQNLQKDLLEINNHAYSSTIMNGLPECFRDYDVKYSAQDGGGCIDYPLAIEITDLTGFEFVNEYLTRLSMENNFCRQFSEIAIRELLEGYNEDYPDLLINLFEIILTNASGLLLLQKDFYRLDIREEERQDLYTLLKSCTELKLGDILIDAAEKLYGDMNLNSRDLLKYMKNTAHLQSQRLYHVLEMNKLDMFFISFKKKVVKDTPEFQDGEPMEDDKLRKLIEEMQESRDTGDKITMVQTYVHSLMDLAEILDICFYGEEFNEVFKLLNSMEASVLLSLINEEDEKDWQKALKNYILTTG